MVVALAGWLPGTCRREDVSLDIPGTRSINKSETLSSTAEVFTRGSAEVLQGGREGLVD